MPNSWVRWSKKEESLLEKWAGVYSPEQMVEMLKNEGCDRTIAALSKKIYLLGMSSHRELDNFSAQGVANMIGISLPTVLRWIRKGHLKAKTRGSLRTQNLKKTEYLVERKDLSALLSSPPPGLRKSRIEKIDPEIVEYLLS